MRARPPAAASLATCTRTPSPSSTRDISRTLLTERAVGYLARRHDRPFYLSLHYTAPHAPWEGPPDARRRSSRSRPRADDQRRLARHLCADDAQLGRRRGPRARSVATRAARARHAGDLHERQRRRAILVQLAVLVAEGLFVRGRHPRARDRALARRRAGGCRDGSSGDHDGLGSDDPRGGGRATRRGRSRSTARACFPC